jgi:tetratricopeptide (TPR) repeat protein
MRGILGVLLISAGWLGGQTALPTFQGLSRQAEVARDSKQLDKALALYRQAVKLKPDWDEGWWNLGSLAYDLDQYAECAPAFHRLAVLKPDSAPAWTMAGLCEYRLRSYEAAADSLSHAEQLKFQGPVELARSARLHLALVLTKTGRFERAITVLTEMTLVHKVAPDVAVAAGIAGLRQPWLPNEVPEESRELVYMLGDAMGSAMEKDYRQATEKFEAALRQYPQEANVHFRFGAFLNIQDSARGVEEIQKAVELAPNHVPALVGLTVMHLKREEFDSALEMGERAVKAGPEDFSTHIALGRALLAKENPARAAAELEVAVKLAPASPEARFSLASAYSRLSRKADAARELAEFKKLQHFEK